MSEVIVYFNKSFVFKSLYKSMPTKAEDLKLSLETDCFLLGIQSG